MVAIYLPIYFIKSTFDKAIDVLQLASTSWTETSSYNWNTYETQPVVVAFTELESEIKDRYKLLKVCIYLLLAPILRDVNPYYQAADEWHNAEDLLLEAISKDRERVEKMNERISKVRFMSSRCLTARWLIVFFRFLLRWSTLLRRISSSPSLSSLR